MATPIILIKQVQVGVESFTIPAGNWRISRIALDGDATGVTVILWPRSPSLGMEAF